MEFKDKVVLITGASSGLGAATAIYLSQQSAKLAIVGRREKNLKDVAAQCEKSKGLKPLQILADVSNDSDVARIVSETIKHFGKLDVLVNNAGTTELGGVKDTTMEKYDKVMSVNLRGVFFLTQLAVPHLIKTKGNIVNISSIASTKPYPGMGPYCMSKAALDQFTKCIALELAGDGVRVNAVNPGLIRTNIMNEAGLKDSDIDAMAKETISETPLKRLAEPDDVAAIVAFLASDKAKSITGSTNPVDAGRLLA